MKILNNYQIITLQNYVKHELFILFSQGKLRLDGKFPDACLPTRQEHGAVVPGAERLKRQTW